MTGIGGPGLPVSRLVAGVLLIEVFAGLRTARIALDNLGVPVQGHLSVECQRDLNSLAAMHWPDEIQYESVESLGECELGTFAETHSGSCPCILAAGFPCKDLSKLNFRRQNLSGSRSGLFFHWPRILRTLRRLMSRPTLFIFECTFMDEDALYLVNLELDCLPLRINSRQVSAARRDRLYWCNFSLQPDSAETLQATTSFVDIQLAEDPHRLDILDADSSFHPSFSGALECLTGFRRHRRPPPHPARYESSSQSARAFWSRA